MKSVALIAPRSVSITPAVCAAVIAIYMLVSGAPFAHAATNDTLSPKQMQTIQMLLDTYGVPQDKIKAVSAILAGPRQQESVATSTSPRPQMMGGFNASSTQPIDGEHGSSTRMMPPRPPRPESGGPQSSLDSAAQFVADYSDAFNQNLSAVAAAPFEVYVPIMTDYFSALGFK